MWPYRDHERDEGFQVNVDLSGHRDERDAQRVVATLLQREKVDWLFKRGRGWVFDAEKFRRWLKADTPDTKAFAVRIEWITGVVVVAPRVVYKPRKSGGVDTRVEFSIYQEEYMVTSKTRIFLSHKGADKPMVERFFDTLSLLGFDPWLDKEDMPGGTELHRGIRQGFKDSCAVVFFITPNFKDESHLRNEINYAVEEKTAKGGRFAIITLVFKHDGQEGTVPDILQSYVWKHPANELEATNEIIRGLPIELGPIAWKDGV